MVSWGHGERGNNVSTTGGLLFHGVTTEFAGQRERCKLAFRLLLLVCVWTCGHFASVGVILAFEDTGFPYVVFYGNTIASFAVQLKRRHPVRP